MISVIIPAYNIYPNINLVKEALQGFEHEIIVEFDVYKEGKGAMLQRGFLASKGDRIVWLDADMEIHPIQIRRFLQVDVDVVVASKLHPLSDVQYPTRRRIISWLSALTTKFLFNLPLRDTQTGLKVFKKHILDKDWKIKGFGHDIEVLTHAYHSGATIVEMPVVIVKDGNGTINWKDCFRTFIEMLKVRHTL